jgi:ParB family transcriptional regulator, chromosome partitioning protein
MAEKVATLFAGTSWLPEPLRTPGRELPPVTDADGTSDDSLEETETADVDTQAPGADDVDDTDADAGDDEAAVGDEPDVGVAIAAD